MHQHVVEQTQQRQVRVQPITHGAADHHGLGLDLQGVQDGDQQRRLGFAVTVASGPGGVGIRRNLTASTHGQRHVPDPVLDQREGGLRPRLRIGGKRPDARHLRLQGTLGLQHCRLLVEGRQKGREVRPGAEIRQLDHPADAISGRRAFGRDNGFDIVQGQLDAGCSPQGHGLQGRKRAGRPDLCFQRRRPPHEQVRAFDRDAVPGGRDTLDMALEDGIPGRDRCGHIEDVADLETLRLQVGRQHPVQRRTLEVRLTSQDCERLS